MVEMEEDKGDARIWLPNNRRIFYSFGRLLKWRRRTKEHCVLRLGLTFLVAVLRENEIRLSNEVGEISD